ncbi:MAG: hypothetical protein IID40_06160, partial [Planctomycetes bacterium]|nr:hypothetical protein [Planctomycetota bacterium]
RSVGSAVWALGLAVMTWSVSAAAAPSDPAEIDGAAVIARRGAVIPITGEISDVTFESVERRVAQARADGAEVLIFEIDTPGGAVISAIEICDLIKNLTELHTVAWVHTKAISAGSMISMACDEIVMSPSSMIGDCGVLMGTPLGVEAVPEELRAKAESPVLAQFRDSANRYGYSKALCEALVVKERVVWWIENVETGERFFVDDKVKTRRLGDADDRDPTSQPTAAAEGQWRLVESYTDAISGRQIDVEQPIVDEHELLTMSQSEAIAFGFSKGLASGDADLRERYNLTGQLTTYEFTWAELLVRYLTSMPVRIILLILILLGAYVEFHTPGVGLPGLVALIGLAVFVGAPYLTGLATAWDLVLIVLGILLILLELFVIPGFGIAGVAGVLLVLVGIFGTFVPAEPGPWRVVPTLPATWEAVKSGLMAIMVSVLVSVTLMWYLARHLPQVPMANQLILSGEVARGQTLDAGSTAIATAGVDPGDRGEALTVLRPAGTARLRGERRDVVTQGEMVEQGAALEVVEVLGNRIVVRQADDGAKGLA